MKCHPFVENQVRKVMDDGAPELDEGRAEEVAGERGGLEDKVVESPDPDDVARGNLPELLQFPPDEQVELPHRGLHDAVRGRRLGGVDGDGRVAADVLPGGDALGDTHLREDELRQGILIKN